MATYAEMEHVLHGNEQIIRQIRDHAQGSTAPFIPGMTPEAFDVLTSAAGRPVSLEFAKALAPSMKALNFQRQQEANFSTKRPAHALERDVVFTSNAIGHYVHRLQLMAEDSSA